MRYFPIFTDTAGRCAVVVGGGEDAARKVRLLLKTQARVTVFAARLNDELFTLAETGRITWRAETFDVHALPRPAVVIAAADDKTNETISAAARAHDIAINVVDRPDLSTFIIPALVDRDPLVIAVGTEGAGPVLAQGLRARIEALLPPGIGEVLERARALRQTVARALPAGKARRAFWRNFFFGPLSGSIMEGEDDGMNGNIDAKVSAALFEAAAVSTARVRVVGVPEDDLECLTLKAHRALQEADVIVHANQGHGAVLEYARRDAERVAASPIDPAGTLVALAARGKDVVHLVDVQDLALFAFSEPDLPCGTAMEIIEPARSSTASAAEWSALQAMTAQEAEQWTLAA